MEILDLELLMRPEMAHAVEYEQQITALERSLALELKNTRERVSSYKAKKRLVEDHIRLAKQENWLNVPLIIRSLDECLEKIHEVEWRLPGIRSQLLEVKNIYDLGRRRAKILEVDMEWKAKSDFEQWRSTLLGKSPLSPRQVKREWLRLLWRLLGAILVLVFFVSLFRAIIRGHIHV